LPVPPKSKRPGQAEIKTAKTPFVGVAINDFSGLDPTK